MDIEHAIDLLREKYAKAEALPFVVDPVAWALYHTWRDVDEQNRRTRDATEKVHKKEGD